MENLEGSMFNWPVAGDPAIRSGRMRGIATSFLHVSRGSPRAEPTSVGSCDECLRVVLPGGC